MPFVATAVSAIASSFAATTLGTFLTTTFVGRLLTNVVVSALRAALSKKKSRKANAPGIRTAQTLTGGTNPASFVFGKYATQGQLVSPSMSHTSSGSSVPNNILTYVIELSDLPGQSLDAIMIDGEYAPITDADAYYGKKIGGRFINKAWIRYYDGSQTSADQMLLEKYGVYPHRPWTSDMVGHGICYAIVTFNLDRSVYSAFPRLRFVLGGIPLYDPRSDSSVGGDGTHRWPDRSTWTASDNPVVMIYNILRGIDLGGGKVWGGQSAAADLPLASWFAAMNACDLAVETENGSTEPAYRAGYEVYVDDEPATVIEELLKACSGQIAEIGGQYVIRVGGPGLPVYFFTDDDVLISDPRELDAFPPPDETFNTITAVYPDPDALWEPRDAPERVEDAAVLADGGPLIANVQFDAVPYPEQVQRLMRSDLRDDRRFTRHTISLPSDAIPLQPLDTIAWTSARHGYVTKAFEVSGVVDPILTGNPRLALRERDPADYSWTGADVIPAPPPSALPNPAPIHVLRPSLDDLDPSVGYALGGNLLTNSDFSDGTTDWIFSGNGAAFTDTVASILAPGQPYAGRAFPTFAMVQSSGETVGDAQIAYRKSLSATSQGFGVSTTPGQVLEFQMRASVDRCGMQARYRYFDAEGTDLGVSDPIIDQPAEAPGDPNDAAFWPLYWGRAVVPVNAAYASIEIIKLATAAAAVPASSAIYWHSPQIAVTVENALNVVPYRVSGLSKISGARILAGAITAESGIIADLAVDTLQIRDNAVTIPVGVQTNASNVLSTIYDAGPDPLSVAVICSAIQSVDSYLELTVDGIQRWLHRPAPGTVLTEIEFMQLSPGSHTIRLSSTSPANNRHRIFILGIKK